MQFKDYSLRPIVLRNLTAMSFRSPTEVQQACAVPILRGQDVVALAPTGSGKTVAYLAPMAHVLIDTRPRKPTKSWAPLRALVLCPTRELTIQVQNVSEQIFAGSALHSVAVYGKSAIGPQKAEIARGVDLLVATPGRARELLDGNGLSLSSIRMVVLDEADRMLDMGFLPQVERLLREIPTPRQVVLFSATMPREVEELVERICVKPERIEVAGARTAAQHVNLRAISVSDEMKTPVLLRLLKPEEAEPLAGVVVFCRTRRRVGWVAAALERHGIRSVQFHGDRSQASRIRALEAFRSGSSPVLIATDVAARGLHIESIRLVINYDLPFDPEDFIHRVGRSEHGANVDGRPREGKAISLVSFQDREVWDEIQRRMQGTIALERAPEADEFVLQRKLAKRAKSAATGKAGSKKRGQPQRPSFRSRPIREGQKPGGGVRRSKPSEGSSSPG